MVEVFGTVEDCEPVEYQLQQLQSRWRTSKREWTQQVDDVVSSAERSVRGQYGSGWNQARPTVHMSRTSQVRVDQTRCEKENK
jgi:hypothetical protein